MTPVAAAAGRRAPRLRFTAVVALLSVVFLAGCADDVPKAATEPTPSSTSVPSLLTSPQLANWAAALQNRSNKTARWLAVGDSITEGQGASARSKRWLSLATQSLRGAYPVEGVKGGAGYLPATYAVYYPDSKWADWWSDTSGTIVNDFTSPGLGVRSIEMQPGARRSYPFTGTDLDVWWTRGTGAFTIAIDGGTAYPVDTSGTYAAGNKTAVRGLTSASHTVTITATGSKPLNLEGFTVYDGDRNRGIVTFDSAHAGATIDTYLKDLPNFLRAARATWPALVTVAIGGNDATTETPSQVNAKYLRLVRALKALPSHPSILLISEFQPGSTMGDKFRAPWSEYIAGVRSIAKKTGSGYLSLYDRLPHADESGSGIYSTDGSHPNDYGQALIASIVSASIG